MIVSYKYRITPNIIKLVQQIEKLKTKLDLLPRNKYIEKINRQKSILKSAVYSARIEGNPKNFNEVSRDTIKNSKQKQKKELDNLYIALEHILSSAWKENLNIKDIKRIHKFVLKNLSSQAGFLRQESSAIYNQAGIAIYVCPPVQEVRGLLVKWLEYVNGFEEPFVPIKAAVSHFSFEKIHPFLDGNGRVGRLLVHLILKRDSYDLRGLVAFEEQLEKNRSKYYDLLNINKKDITPFIEFFLHSLKDSLKKSIKIRQAKRKIMTEDLLPPRRFEILQTIRDHQQVSLDFISRRFLSVSKRLLSYDLKKLRDAGFIRKRGVTKGAVYEPISV